jgi:hypothetical protein
MVLSGGLSPYAFAVPTNASSARLPIRPTSKPDHKVRFMFASFGE